MATVDTLQRTITKYKDHIKQISELHRQTQQCLKEIQDFINLDEQNFNMLQNLPHFDFENRMPCVLFIGSQNCGKSTLLNVFLGREKFLPVHENPCTSRIVRVLYSKTNYARVLDTQSNEIERKEFKKNVPKAFVVVKDDQRENKAHLENIVEVGLDHPLLESGIELLDSPGRNENEALNGVVDEIVQKGIVPLIVYVVDGNLHVREGDLETIRELQDRFPNVSLVFVCSKVDKVKKAVMFDDDDVSTDGIDFMDPNEDIIELATVKKREVFRKLKEHSFLASEENLETTIHFHGVSARNVEKARKRSKQNHDTLCFDRFECAILQKLENALKKDSKKALDILLSAQETILLSVVNTKRSLSNTTNLIPSVCDQALKTELLILQTTLKLGFQGDEIKNTIRRNLEHLSPVFMDEGENYEVMDKGTVLKELKTIKETVKIDPELLKQVRLEEQMLIEFMSTMKGIIIDKTFNVLKVAIHGCLREVLSQTVGELIKLTQTVRDPLIGRLVKRIFGASAKPEDDVNSFLQLHVVLDGLLDSVDSAVNATLRKEISTPLSEFDANCVGKNPRPRDMHWRRKVVQTLLSRLDYQLVATRVIAACDESILKLHKLFRETVESYRTLNNILERDKLPETVQKLRTTYVPRMAELAVRGHSLHYLVERGQPVLGELVKSTKHGRIYSCCSRQWFQGQNSAMVKVVSKRSVDVKVWQQTMLDCLHYLDVNQKLGGRCSYHLQLYGWYFPEPDQLYIIMEKAECDLLTALQRGLSWKRRKEIAIDVANGIQAIHSVDYVYQDVKAENVMITEKGIAKLNLAKPEKPYEPTQLGGQPFHISPKMFQQYGTDRSTDTYDIYAYGSLLWVLCEGSGTNSPKAYCDCQDIDSVKVAVCDRGITPERPAGTPDAWWELMSACWDDGGMNIKDVLDKALKLEIPE